MPSLVKVTILWNLSLKYIFLRSAVLCKKNVSSCGV